MLLAEKQGISVEDAMGVERIRGLQIILSQYELCLRTLSHALVGSRTVLTPWTPWTPLTSLTPLTSSTLFDSVDSVDFIDFIEFDFGFHRHWLPPHCAAEPRGPFFLNLGA